MNWYIVDKKYINYLTQFDSHDGYVKCSYLFRQTQTSENVKQSGFPQTSG